MNQLAGTIEHPRGAVRLSQVLDQVRALEELVAIKGKLASSGAWASYMAQAVNVGGLKSWRRASKAPTPRRCARRSTAERQAQERGHRAGQRPTAARFNWPPA